jgi:thiol-disulfide isomerase/thioredoxin
MRNVLLILAVVLALIAGTYFADKGTRGSRKPSMHADVSADKSVGSMEPEVAFKDLNSKEVSLAQYRGKVVLINFWATWCDPCREEIPWLIEMQQKYGDKGFTVLGIAMDEEGQSVVAPFVNKEQFSVGGQKLNMNYPIVVGTEEIASKFGGLLGYPTSVLISRDGKIVKRITGLIDAEGVSRTIEGLL